MGLTIHYRGTLRNTNHVKLMMDDLADICHDIGWHYMPIHRSNVMPVQGLVISPPGSEPLWLTFLENGKMYDPTHFIFTQHPDQEVIDEDMHTCLFTKTQYAGVDVHMAIIKFFRYLKMKYLDNFELQDESQFWETDDPSVCLIRFDQYDEIINTVSHYLNAIEDDPENESVSARMDETLLRRGGLGMNMN